MQVQIEDCSPLRDLAVDVWHCDANGAYSGFPDQLGGIGHVCADLSQGHASDRREWHRSRQPCPACHGHGQHRGGPRREHSRHGRLVDPQAMANRHGTMNPLDTEPLSVIDECVFDLMPGQPVVRDVIVVLAKLRGGILRDAIS